MKRGQHSLENLSALGRPRSDKNLHQNRLGADKDPEIPNHWGVYFAVDDTAGPMETAEATGGHVTYGPWDIPDVGVFAGLADPYGASFTVIQIAQPVDRFAQLHLE